MFMLSLFLFTIVILQVLLNDVRNCLQIEGTGTRCLECTQHRSRNDLRLLPLRHV